MKPMTTALKNLNSNKDKFKIEFFPLAYMQGMTFTDCYVILDEAQNASPDQMRTFLTRLGFGSKMVIVGDVKQSYYRGRNGFAEALDVLKDANSVNTVYLDNSDNQRHPVVKEIMECYNNVHL